MAAISRIFRQRILKTYDRGDITCEQLADREAF
jgi:hypothetical protein